MARPTKLLSATSKNYTKEEIALKKAQEEALYDYEKLDMSDIPMYLDELAKQEWKRIVPLLNELPISELDRQAVAQYCVFSSVFQQATEDFNINGPICDGKVNPAIHIMNNASKELKSMANSLGLNINARLKIVVPEPVQEDDPFANMLAKADRK